MEKDMKEKITISPEEEAKAKKIQLDSVIADRDNKLKELAEFSFNLEVRQEEFTRLEREEAIFKKVLDLIINNYDKDRAKCDFAWEKQAEYWEAKKEQEIISGERKMVEFKIQKRNLQREIDNAMEQMESLEASLKIIEEQEMKK